MSEYLPIDDTGTEAFLRRREIEELAGMGVSQEAIIADSHPDGVRLRFTGNGAVLELVQPETDPKEQENAA